ncbi:hypothetical protein MLD38_020678 [Melastoma candidum]|uniref:Uncharacterized protein n=1 Tax=Melastoma candidum TaxID=119954 RepID=A0ACB9QGV8_9MYRT|nr:hypothetical protein MLD38_020678 [Melastoma candidum]
MDPHPQFPPASAAFLHLLLLLLLVAAPVVVVMPASSLEVTIYDHLRRYGLPIGLFPKGITTYTLDPSDGSFLLNLPQPCNAKFENEVHYDFNVSGVLLFGQISNISGVSAQELFLWFPVKHIRVDVPASGLIHFDVGVVDKQFSLSLFERPPDCSTSASPSVSTLNPLSFPKPEERVSKAAS